MDQNPPHSQSISHEAGVLTASSTETLQRVVGDVVPSLYADLLDRIGHIVDSNTQEPSGQLFRRARGLSGRCGDLCRQLFEPMPNGVQIKRLIAIGAKHLWEMRR